MTKYGRVLVEFGVIPEDEPVFLLRAQDVLAPVAVETYASLLRAAARGADESGDVEQAFHLRGMAEDVSNHAATMVAWQAGNRAKLPD